MDLLLRAGANPHVTGRDGRTPLAYALQEIGDGCFNMVMRLFDATATEETTYSGEISYLHMLTMSRKSVSVRRLAKKILEKGANVNTAEGNGKYVGFILSENINSLHVNTF